MVMMMMMMILMMMMRLMTDDGDGVDDDEPKSSGFACLPPGDSFSYFSLMVKIMMMYVYDDDGYDDLYDYNNDHDGYDDDKDDDDDDDPVMEPRPCLLTSGQGCGGDAPHTDVSHTNGTQMHRCIAHKYCTKIVLEMYQTQMFKSKPHPKCIAYTMHKVYHTFKCNRHAAMHKSATHKTRTQPNKAHTMYK